MPIFALGALVLGGIFAYETLVPKKESDSSSKEGKGARAAAAAPQSYIVTPLEGPARAPNGMLVTDAINKFIV